LASFIVHPAVELEARHQSNIFRTEERRKSDEIAILRPSLAIASDWTNHSVALSAAGEIGRHRHYQREDFENYRLSASGRLDAHSDLAFNGDTRVELIQEPRGTPDDPGTGFEPVKADVFFLGGGARYLADAILLHLKASRETRAFSGGDPVATVARDRVESIASLRVGWEFVPGTTVFVEPSYNIREYDREFDAQGFRQDSHGYRVLVGATWDISGVTFAEFGIGYMRQIYDETLFTPISGPSADGKLIWNATETVTLTAALSRTIGETTVIGASGVAITDGALTLDYEYLDNLIFSARMSYSDQRFRGTERSDSIVTAGVGADYRIGANWYARLGLDRATRSSNVAGGSFTDNAVSLRVGQRL
jgi:hypothetical protein